MYIFYQKYHKVQWRENKSNIILQNGDYMEVLEGIHSLIFIY